MTDFKLNKCAGFVGASGFVLMSLFSFPSQAEEKATVITITQVACQFLEVENGVDHNYTSNHARECQAINRTTGAKRLSVAKTLNLKPGKYIFRVTNKDVPYDLGFWVREKGYQLGNKLHKETKISVAGGGLKEGETKDYAVVLKPGEYRYSCPLNPTPDYKIIVSSGRS